MKFLKTIHGLITISQKRFFAMRFIKYLSQVVPHDFIDGLPIFVTKGNRTIVLKNDYLCDLFHHIHTSFLYYQKDQTNKERHFQLCAKQLIKKYGIDYAFYLQYLMEVPYIRLVRNYTKGSHCNTYKFLYWKLNSVQMVQYQNKDSKMIDNYKRLLYSSRESSIYTKRLMNTVKDNLQSVTIEKEEAVQFLKALYPDQNDGKYYKNYISILNIGENEPYLISDEHGRIHTNFTVLKKEIRNQFIRIDGEPIKEKDISNSQALFFLNLLSNNLNKSINQTELIEFKDRILDGVLYDNLASHSGMTRADTKEQFFRYLFGGVKSQFIEFNNLYPTISKFISRYKRKLGNYKLLSHELQLLEGEFIFKGICPEMTKQKIKYFTVHDSICVKASEYDKMALIFDSHLDNLKQKISEKIQNYFRSDD